MKMYKGSIDSRKRKQVVVDEIQFGFMPGKRTIDAKVYFETSPREIIRRY